MNAQAYSYSLLQYRHSQALGEVLNIGVLVYFHASHHLNFICPERIHRLKNAYSDVSEKAIKSYFDYFKEKVFATNNKTDLLASNQPFSLFIADLIPPDSSSLGFGELNKGICYTSEQEVLKNLEALYLGEFKKHNEHKDRVDDTYLISAYKKQLRQLKPDFYESKKIVPIPVIRPKEGLEIRFDFGWQNGTYNLIKAASFDVNTPERIQNKAYKFFGQFTDLQDYAIDQNIRFDLLVAKPSRKSLFKTFDNAIELLQKPKKVKVVYLDELSSYSQATIEALENVDREPENDPN